MFDQLLKNSFVIKERPNVTIKKQDFQNYLIVMLSTFIKSNTCLDALTKVSWYFSICS